MEMDGHLKYTDRHDPDKAGFTPVKRPKQIVEDSPRGCTDAVPWTISKCKRVLRPLTSRLAHLRKSYIGNDDSQSQQPSRKDIVNEEPLLNSEEEVNDPDWHADGLRKRIRHTYGKGRKAKRVSNRHDRTESPFAAPGIRLLQPLVNDKRQGSTAPSDQQGQQPAPRKKRKYTNTKPAKASRSSFKTLAKDVRPSQWELYDGIYNALDNLLKATTPTTTPRRTGARSLFSACIRAIPFVIAQDELDAEAESPEHKDEIEERMFEELESLSTTSDGSWKPFRDICRSQGIFGIAQAIHAGLIPLSLADSLVQLCLDDSADHEAKVLVEAMVLTVQSIRDPDSPAESLYSHEISYALHALKRLEADHMGFVLEAISVLVENDAIPLTWVTHPDMINIWNRALDSIVQEDSTCSHAMGLLEAALTHWTHDLIWILPTTSSMVSSYVYQSVEEQHQKLLRPINPLNDLIGILLAVTYAQDMPLNLNGTISSLSGYSLQALRSLAIASYSCVGIGATTSLWHFSRLAFLLACSEEANETITNLSTKHDIESKLTRFSAAIVLNTAWLIAKELSLDVFGVIQRLAQHCVGCSAEHIYSTLLRNSAISAARLFADCTGWKEHRIWAERLAIEYEVRDSQPQPLHIHVDDNSEILDVSATDPPESFRWDKTIGDFVVCSPIQISIAQDDVFEDDILAFDLEEVIKRAKFDLEEPQLNLDPKDLPKTKATQDRLPTTLHHSNPNNNHQSPQTSQIQFFSQFRTPESAKIGRLRHRRFLSKLSNARHDVHAAKMIEDSATDFANLLFDLDINGSFRSDVEKTQQRSRDAFALTRRPMVRLEGQKGSSGIGTSVRGTPRVYGEGSGDGDSDELCT